MESFWWSNIGSALWVKVPRLTRNVKTEILEGSAEKIFLWSIRSMWSLQCKPADSADLALTGGPRWKQLDRIIAFWMGARESLMIVSSRVRFGESPIDRWPLLATDRQALGRWNIANAQDNRPSLGQCYWNRTNKPANCVADSSVLNAVGLTVWASLCSLERTAWKRTELFLSLEADNLGPFSFLSFQVGKRNAECT